MHGNTLVVPGQAYEVGRLFVYFVGVVGQLFVLGQFLCQNGFLIGYVVESCTPGKAGGLIL